MLRVWNKNTFGRVERHIQELEDFIEQLKGMLQQDPSQEVEVNYLLTKVEWDVWEVWEEIHLAQKAKKKWLQEGDNYSRFFHAMVNQRQRTSTIHSMKLNDGTILSSFEEIHQGATRYFQDSFPVLILLIM